MKRRENTTGVWAQAEDCLFPALGLGSHERALYYHLLRHSHGAGRRTMRTSRARLAHGLNVSRCTARHYLGCLERAGCLKIIERGQKGLQVEVWLPKEILTRIGAYAATTTATARVRRARNHFKVARVRKAIFRREGGRCFYCGGTLRRGGWGLDHVVPLVAGGDNSPGNAVACCHECNCAKGESPAADYLQRLYREARLTRTELRERLAALKQARAQ